MDTAWAVPPTSDTEGAAADVAEEEESGKDLAGTSEAASAIVAEPAPEKSKKPLGCGRPSSSPFYYFYQGESDAGGVLRKVCI